MEKRPTATPANGTALLRAWLQERAANLVWKDTVLVRSGETVDILLDITNPGQWPTAASRNTTRPG